MLPAATERPLSDLLNTADPGWPVVLDLIAAATNAVEVLPRERARSEQTLLRLQVTTRAPLGAIAYECGGLLIDHGWVRVLGGGHSRLPRDVASWNLGAGEDRNDRLPGALLVADDVLGGFFAINGDAFPGPPKNVHYFAPDTLAWEDLGRGYTEFLRFLMVADLDAFYEERRWPGWQDEVSQLNGDSVFSILPFLWVSGPPIAERSRRAVPVDELWGLQQEIRRKLVEEGSG